MNKYLKPLLSMETLISCKSTYETPWKPFFTKQIEMLGKI